MVHGPVFIFFIYFEKLKIFKEGGVAPKMSVAEDKKIKFYFYYFSLEFKICLKFQMLFSILYFFTFFADGM